MDALKKIPGMFKRRGADGTQNWYYRTRVPKDLLGEFKGSEVRRSLGTPDLKDAVPRAHVVAAEIVQLFENVRRRMPEGWRSIDDLSDAEIRRMILVWFCNREQRASEKSLEILNQGDLAEAIINTEHDLSHLREPDDPTVMAAVQGEVDAILLQHGFKEKNRQGGTTKHRARRPQADVDTRSPKYWKLCELVQRGMIVGTRHTLARLRGQPIDRVFDPLFSGVDRPVRPDLGYGTAPPGSGALEDTEREPGSPSTLSGKPGGATLEQDLLGHLPEPGSP